MACSPKRQKKMIPPGKTGRATLISFIPWWLLIAWQGSKQYKELQLQAQKHPWGRIPQSLCRHHWMWCWHISTGLREPPVCFLCPRGLLGWWHVMQRSALNGSLVSESQPFHWARWSRMCLWRVTPIGFPPPSRSRNPLGGWPLQDLRRHPLPPTNSSWGNLLTDGRWQKSWRMDLNYAKASSMDNARIKPLAHSDNTVVEWWLRRSECVAPGAMGLLHARTSVNQLDGAPRREGRPPSGSQIWMPMADLMSGPNAPLTKAFLFCGWRCITVDWLLDPSHDLANPVRQDSLATQLQAVDFIGAAMDCSTKSRARETPRNFDDGRPAPQPLRSVEFPEGLPNLRSSDQARVHTDNVACRFLLDQIQLLADRGGASVRENPWRSLHWYLPQEQAMMATGQWQDKRYASCCFMGARSKSQCLRHNLLEINEWPVLDCHHVHDSREWEPSVVNGKRIYPSHEEAEYTAPLAFAIAVAASWWAVRTGRATLHVPRMPAINCHGRREHWLAIDPRAMRAWAMAPLAISLGLEPPDPSEAARVPKRGRVVDFLDEAKGIPPDCIYVGRGHHSHRLTVSKWKTPVVPGHDCPPEEWVARYVDHICSSEVLWQSLPELQGKTLLCDCPWQDLCEADLLAGLVFEATAPQTQTSGPPRGTGSHSDHARGIVTAVAASQCHRVLSHRSHSCKSRLC